MDKIERLTLYGSKSSNVAGYCKHHSRYLTVRQIKEHECLAKQCWHLDKKEHPWWKYRTEMKQKRKDRKELIYGGRS